MLQSRPTRSLVVACSTREFRAAGEKRCERGHGQVCMNLMSWRPKRIRTIRTFVYPDQNYPSQLSTSVHDMEGGWGELT